MNLQNANREKVSDVKSYDSFNNEQVDMKLKKAQDKQRKEAARREKLDAMRNMVNYKR